jgi:hypothetical protein
MRFNIKNTTLQHVISCPPAGQKVEFVQYYASFTAMAKLHQSQFVKP